MSERNTSAYEQHDIEECETTIDCGCFAYFVALHRYSQSATNPCVCVWCIAPFNISDTLDHESHIHRSC